MRVFAQKFIKTDSNKIRFIFSSHGMCRKNIFFFLGRKQKKLPKPYLTNDFTYFSSRRINIHHLE